MSNWRLKDHDTLVLRYTLACGWDVGATMGSEGKGSAGYCAGCTNGTWWVNHTFQKQKDGTYACTACGLTQNCPHTNSHWKDLGNGSCIQICDDENGKEIGEAKAMNSAAIPQTRKTKPSTSVPARTAAQRIRAITAGRPPRHRPNAKKTLR